MIIVTRMTTMKRLMIFCFVAALSLSSRAQQLPIEHTPGECMKGEDKNVIEATLASKGEPRCYYRTVGAEEWCWVVGERAPDDPNQAKFILPKFRSGIEIDYFFLTLDSTPEITDLVTGKSTVVYRVAVRDRCVGPLARSSDIVLTRCAASGAPVAIAAAYSIGEEVSLEPPSPSSPLATTAAPIHKPPSR